MQIKKESKTMEAWGRDSQELPEWGEMRGDG